MPASRHGGHRLGAGRPSLPLEALKRPDLAERRKLRRDRPSFDLHGESEGAGNGEVHVQG